MSVPPTHRVSFPDSDYIASIAYSADSKEIYVALNVQSLSLWRTFLNEWPYTFGGIALILVAIGLVLLRRGASRPQRVGRSYCKGCNHEIVDRAIPCPECGRTLESRRSVVAGKSTRRRMAPGLTLIGVPILAYGAMWVTPRSFLAPMWGWFDLWSDRVLRFAADHKIAWLEKQRESATRISVIDVATGTRVRDMRTLFGTFVRDPDGDQRIVVAPDGGSVYVPFQRNSFASLDPASGRVVRRFALGPHDRFGDIAGVTPDGATIYATFYDTPQNLATLVRFDANTGERAIVTTASGDIVIHPSTHQEMRMPPRFHLIPYAPEPMFIQTPSQRLILNHGVDQQPCEFSWFLERSPDDHHSIDGWIDYALRPTPLGLEGRMVFQSSDFSLDEFDIDTGRVRPLSLFWEARVSEPFDDNARRRLIFGSAGSPIDDIVAFDSNTHELVGQTILPPLGGDRRLRSALTTAPDLSSLATIIFRSTKNSAGTQYFYDLYIYDLTPYPKLRELEFGVPDPAGGSTDSRSVPR